KTLILYVSSDEAGTDIPKPPPGPVSASGKALHCGTVFPHGSTSETIWFSKEVPYKVNSGGGGWPTTHFVWSTRSGFETEPCSSIRRQLIPSSRICKGVLS